MNKIKFLASVISVGLLVLSCNKDNSHNLSPASVKQAFSAVNADLASDISGLNSSPGNVAWQSFSNLTSTSNPFGRIKSIHPLDIRGKLSAGLLSIRKMFHTASGNARVQGDQPFDYNSKKGVYTWNRDTKTFSKTSSSDIIKIDYPKDASSTTNNAEFQLSAYAEQSTAQGYQPTLVQAAFYVDQVKQGEIKLTMAYKSNGNVDVGNIDLFIGPYSVSFILDDSKPTTTSESLSFSKSGKTLIGASITITYPTSDSKLNGGPPSALTGYVQLENVRFNAAIDGTKTATSNDLNDVVFIAIIIDGNSAGKVVFVTDPKTGDQKPYVLYNDNTKESLDLLFADLSTQLHSLGF